MTRRIALVAFVWSLVIIWPLLAVWVGNYFLNIHYGTSLLDDDIHVLIINTVVAGLPFLILAIAVQLHPRSSEQRKLRGSIVATSLLVAAAALPWGSLYYSSLTYIGGGANIGLALLLLASPLYLPLLIPIGLWLGEHRSPRAN